MFLINKYKQLEEKAVVLITELLLGKDFNKERDEIPELPCEIYSHIFSFLSSPKDLAHASLVSKEWDVLANDSAIWTKLLNKHFPNQKVFDVEEAKEAYKILYRSKKLNDKTNGDFWDKNDDISAVEKWGIFFEVIGRMSNKNEKDRNNT